MTGVTSLQAGPGLVDLVLEQRAAPMRWQGSRTYAVARRCDGGGAQGLWLVAVRSPESAGATVSVPATDLVRVPDPLPPDAAILAPAVARLLGLWDSLELELGELAVLAGGHPIAGLAKVVAEWYGAQPVLVDRGQDGEGVFTIEGVERPARDLAATLKAAPGVAAVDLSGSPDLVDILLEALPAYTRLMLAGAAREPLTIDFYVNVHRKGLTVLSGILDPASEFDEASGRARIARALRLLGHADRTALCRAALGGRALADAG